MLSTVYIISIGIRFIFYIFALQAGDMSSNKPEGVEGFLPISALLGFKQLVMTGQYDTVHAAGLSIFLAIIITSLIFKKSFCSHLCPVGLASEQVSKLGKRLHIPAFIPVWALKYVLLGFFIYVIFIAMDLQAVQSFLMSPYNIVSDYKMLKLFAPPSLTTLVVLGALGLLTLVFNNFWCKYLCPYGALLGLVSLLSPMKMRRDAQACIDCKKCRAACPASINVYKKKIVINPDCNTCQECSKACPADCLHITKNKYSKYIPIAVLSLFLILIVIAMLSGHWESMIPNEMYQKFMNMNIGHP
jgi:polyferredoxin